MTGRTDRDEIRLVFRPLPDSVPWPHRVRALLKHALRSLNLRCVRVEGLPADEPETTETSVVSETNEK